MAKLPYTITPKGISVVIGNKMRTITSESKNYQALREELVKPKHDVKRIEELVDVRSFIARKHYKDVQISDDAVLWRGVEVHGAIVDRMLNMLRDGEDLEPLSLFLDKLMQNPSESAKQELFQWLEAGNAPICEDGDFLAFKRVNENYRDCHTDKIDNSVGQVVSMQREEVDPVRDHLCSRGLHFCQHDYLRQFGGAHTMIVKINPADVVSIPTDYNFQKGRCWRYVVVGEVDNDTDKSASTFDNVNVDRTFSKKEEPKAEKKAAKAVKAPAKKKKEKPANPLKKIYGGHNGIAFNGYSIKHLIKKQGGERAAARFIGVTRGRFRNWVLNMRKDGIDV